MGEHVVDIQPFFHIRQVVRIRQLVLLAEIAQLQPVRIVAVLQEFIPPCPGQDVDIVDLVRIGDAFVGGHKVLVDLLPQVVVSPVPAVDIDLDHHVVLVQDPLPFRQRAGHDIPQSCSGKVAVG